jgi:hypothetical protein
MARKKPGHDVPPLILHTSRVLWHATLRKPATYSGHSYLFVNGEEVGPVPRLAICENLARREAGVLVMHCGPRWSVLGVSGYESVLVARTRISRIYPGVEKLWIRATASKRQAMTYLNEVVWQGKRCVFCGRRPYEVEQ